MQLRIRVIAANVVEFYKDRYTGKTHPVIRQVTVEITAQPNKSADTELARPPTQREPSACLESGMW
jgi:hypothetical protein